MTPNHKKLHFFGRRVIWVPILYQRADIEVEKFLENLGAGQGSTVVRILWRKMDLSPILIGDKKIFSENEALHPKHILI